MAYVNVKEWSPDQVTEWLRGLDNVILPYVNSFLNNEVKGHQLLCLRSDDLEHLGVYTLGHQELILEAVEQLRNFHYELDRENLQLLALRLSCAARSLYKELLLAEDASKIETQTMADVANIISTIKPLVCWLDRAPFSGQSDYYDRKTKLLQLSLEMATCAQRDRFAEQPIDKIRTSCYSLAKLADNIIQEISDPMLLQPASLDLATLKKKENELGFSLMPSFHGIHQIAEIKFTSPAHTNNKLEEGDEIVQINYQTVVGWQRKKVLGLFQESPPDIVLTLKKRPRHTKVYGQIYMKPYRLPSKKRQTPYSRWNDNLPSPRPELLTIPDFEMPVPRLAPVTQAQPLESESSSDSEPPDSPLESQGRVYPVKPRPVLQRRNTITGASPTSKRPLQAIEELWNELKHQAAYKHSSSTYIETDTYKRESVYLRDKSASCGHGLELTQRPATYPKKFDKSLLIQDKSEHHKATDNTKKKVNFDENKVIFEEVPVETKVLCLLTNSETANSDLNLEKSISVNSLTSLSQTDEPLKFIDETVDEMYDRSQMNAEWKNEIIEEIIGNIQKKTVPDVVVQKAEPRPQVRVVVKKPPEIPAKPDVLKKPAVPPRNFSTRITTIRGRLDKSYSTPAYDTTQENEKVVLNTSRTPEILITAPETNEPEGNIVEMSPVVETINTALHDIRNSYTEIKDDTQSESKSVEEKVRKLSEVDLLPKNEQRYLAKLADTPPEPPPRTIYSCTTPTETPGKMKHFEPKSISTPISKTPTMDFPSIVDKSTTPDVLKSTSETKVSPTNSVVRAMMNKNKSGKKKNTLIAKRRKVSVKDLNPCDMQGYLYQRLRNKHTQNFPWEKRWFVLLGNCLYGFKTKDASKAECLIFLTGFTVAIAHEVKSRLNAFTVYHTGTAFYFSAENSEAMCSWVELITTATLHSDGPKYADNTLFSESDDSESEKPKTEGKEKSESSRKFGSLKKFTSKKSSSSSSSEMVQPNESTSLDRKYLRFFNNSGSKTAKNQLPVPTPQFRSYRKVVPPNLVVNHQQTSKKPETPKSPEIQYHHSVDVEKPNANQNQMQAQKQDQEQEQEQEQEQQMKNKLKPKPINYIHASNPSLCDINDYRFQSFYQKTRQFTQRNENLSGFVTLEQFMLNRQEEERRQNVLFGKNDEVQINPNSIEPDVVYGEIRNHYSSGDSRTFDTNAAKSTSTSSSSSSRKHTRNNSDGYADRKYKVDAQSKTLPKQLYTHTHVYKEKCELVSDVKMSEPYELQYADKKCLRSTSANEKKTYELIYCPQKVNDVQFAQNRTLESRDGRKGATASKLIRKHSLNSADKKEKLWRRNDKIADRGVSNVRLKSATQYTPMCLPLTPDSKGKLNPKFAFELNLDDKHHHHHHKGVNKFKGFFSTNTSTTTKSSDEKKEKTLLGSPRLHRALFRKPTTTATHQNHHGETTDWTSSLSETQSQVVPLSTNVTPQNPRTGLSNLNTTNILLNNTPPDYPGLEYPPVFEPETYSLANPSCSLTLLRKHQK